MDRGFEMRGELKMWESRGICGSLFVAQKESGGSFSQFCCI
ncbi:hypothetical protein Golax_013802, partial [Gossypium laxum]|nr:hypothetical protein [Gossypium laxum]